MAAFWGISEENSCWIAPVCVDPQSNVVVHEGQLLRAKAGLLTERQIRGPVVVPFLHNDYANGVSP